ncbi:hypothetical protein Efla_002767 [Eimeria flavescens]
MGVSSGPKHHVSCMLHLISFEAVDCFSATTEDDYNFKFAMLDDLLTIVDMENALTGEEKTIGGFDLVYKGKSAAPYAEPLSSSFQKQSLLPMDGKALMWQLSFFFHLCCCLWDAGGPVELLPKECIVKCLLGGSSCEIESEFSVFYTFSHFFSGRFLLDFASSSGTDIPRKSRLH